MQIIKTTHNLRKAIASAKRRKKSIGFVPTMGDLHQGHLSLMRKCRAENDIAVVSIFVNPLQFGPKEDFKNYPRNKNKDVLLTRNENVDIIFYPSEKEIYPRSFLTTIEVAELSRNLCGKFRPGHFKGVATVVVRLLNIVEPRTLYLGQKDAQQAAVVKRVVRDLNMPVKVKVCPIVRDKNGLALSSRNKYLSSRQHQEAAVLFKALQAARQSIEKGNRSSIDIKREMRNTILKKSKSRIEYIECVDESTLKPMKKLNGAVLIALAVWFGKARLIDNIAVKV